MLEPGGALAEGGASASVSHKPIRTATRLSTRRKEPQQQEREVQEEAESEPDQESDPDQPVGQPAQRKRGNSRPDPAAQAAKLAAAREKNRLAQQRFRERQRARQKVAGAQCIVVAKDIEQVGRQTGPRLRSQPSGRPVALASSAACPSPSAYLSVGLWEFQFILSHVRLLLQFHPCVSLTLLCLAWPPPLPEACSSAARMSC